MIFALIHYCPNTPNTVQSGDSGLPNMIFSFVDVYDVNSVRAAGFAMANRKPNCEKPIQMMINVDRKFTSCFIQV